MALPAASAIRAMNLEELESFVAANVSRLGEEEALAALGNRYASTAICQRIAQTPRLTAYYTVRKAVVAHRQTPLAAALKFVHYLYWADLTRMSVDVRIPPQVRRAMDHQLLNRISKLALGEKISVSRLCSREVASVLLRDPDAKVFAAVLSNARLTEDDILATIATGRCTPDQLRVISNDRKWSFRLGVRKALVLNPATPRAVAATQLRHLSANDLAQLRSNPSISLFLKRCIDRLTDSQPTDTESVPS